MRKLFVTMVGKFNAWRERKATEKLLLNLSPHQLEDIGLSDAHH